MAWAQLNMARCPLVLASTWGHWWDRAGFTTIMVIKHIKKILSGVQKSLNGNSAYNSNFALGTQGKQRHPW